MATRNGRAGHDVQKIGTTVSYNNHEEAIDVHENEDKNVLLYMLAGVGLGALIGAAAGLLFAPKPGTETREELGKKFKELKGKTEEWITEQKAKKHKLEKALDSTLEEIGA